MGLKDCSRENLIRVIAKITDSVGKFLNYKMEIKKMGKLATKKIISVEEPNLEWEKNLPENLMTWEEAMEYAKSLGEGWRLPTIEELKYAYNNVQGFQSSYYWSSSTYAQDINDAWGVNFSYGYVNYGSKADSLYVRCVRDVK